MKTISPSQKGDQNIELISSEEIQVSIYLYHHEINIVEGSEFLDDAIRMKDQPLEETNTKENE
jgi:hypothetical protein